MTIDGIAVHTEPLWRAQANFLIRAALRREDAPHRFEQLWARRMDEAEFELCCVPFFTYGMALGDIVRTKAEGGSTHLVEKVMSHSGHSTYRVWFGQKPIDQEEVIAELDRIGGAHERSSRNLIAVDAPDGNVARKVVDYLSERQERGDLLFESGYDANDPHGQR